MDTLYELLLAFHGMWRWLIVVLAVVATGRGLAGWMNRGAWTPGDDRTGKWLVLTLDVQLLLGVLLYVMSPVTRGAMGDMGSAMADTVLRYWTVEHLLGMGAAIVVAHIARARSRRVEDDRRRHRWAALGYGAALLIILVNMPWPFLAYGRELLSLPF